MSIFHQDIFKTSNRGQSLALSLLVRQDDQIYMDHSNNASVAFERVIEHVLARINVMIDEYNKAAFRKQRKNLVKIGLFIIMQEEMLMQWKILLDYSFM